MPAPRRQVQWIALVAAGYAQRVLSKADVAAIFLSRKILLTPDALPVVSASEP